MVININNDVASNAATHSQQKSNKASPVANSLSDSRSAAENTGGNTDKDQVQLSPEAQLFKRLEAKVQSTPEVDQSRVDDIKQQIADGSYTIDASNIAEQLLKHEGL